MDEQGPSAPEVLGQGTEPEPGRGPRTGLARRLPRGAVAVLAVVGVAVGGTLYAGRPDLGKTAEQARAAAAVTPSPVPTPDATALVSGLAEGHDLVAPSAPALDSYIATGGHVLLFVQVRNAGQGTLRILDGVVPQDGASRDLTAGGLAAGTSGGGALPPSGQTEVFVRINVRCPAVLSGPPAAALLLVAEEPGRHPRMERVSLSALGSFWDEARHAACRPGDPLRDVTTSVVPASVRAARADDGTLTVSAVLSVHDAAGFAAVLTGPAIAAGGGRLVVEGGSTHAVPMRWPAGTCAAPAAPEGPLAAPVYRVDLPQVGADGRVALPGSFAAQWTQQVRSACGSEG